MNPTIVLVHGAFAESASWDRVIDPLVSAGHPVNAVANPLRGLTADAVARRSSSASISPVAEMSCDVVVRERDFRLRSACGCRRRFRVAA
jgi:pimeloyl-ACP methyl ester carboxylesterase